MQRLVVGVLVALVAGTFGVPRLHAQGNGVARIFAQFPPGQEVADGVEVTYDFTIVANQSSDLKILFSDSRFYGSGSDTYLIEHNLYTDRYAYSDPVCTTWPLQGDHNAGESSLRVAVPDYVGRGLTGARTSDPAFPRQTYLIDGIPGLWKTDMISQFDMTGMSGTVDVARGDLIVDPSGWRCDGDLDAATSFREWDITVTIGGSPYVMMIALPDAGAHYVTPYEALVFYTEFMNQSGLFKVYFSNIWIQSESMGWQPLNLWKVTDQDGGLDLFGFKKTAIDAGCAIEVSNESQGPYLPPGTVFDISSCQ